MVLMKKSDVCYQRDAFKLKDDDARRQLEVALEAAQRAVLRGGHGTWIVHTMDLVLDGNRPRLELAVLVPSGSDQREELFAAVTFFEVAMTRELGAPVDTAFRIIEDDGPKCEGQACSKKPEWARATRILRFLNKAHFCSDHAKDQKDFPHSGSSDSFWRHLGPTNT